MVLERLTDKAAHVQDANDLATIVRMALGGATVQQIVPTSRELPVIALDTQLEYLLMHASLLIREAGPMFYSSFVPFLVISI